MEMGDKIRILFRGWFEIPHSYAMVNCFQIVNLYKNYKDKIEFYIEEMPYYREDWNNSRKLVYNDEYNEIIKSFKKWNGEELNLIYSITYPYDLNMTIVNNKKIPKCVFYTSEFSSLEHHYFSLNPPLLNDNMVKEYVINNKELYMTSPSVWSSKGMVKYGLSDNKNRIITHGVDTDVFHSNNASRNNIRSFYKIKDTDILMINIGAMTKNKGILLILQLLHVLINKLNKTDYKLLLKGTGDLYNSKSFLEIYFGELLNANVLNKDEMNNLLTNYIIFTDKTLSYTKINELFNACDLYISPYLAEGFNLTCLESLSSGLPILSPRTGSTKEYLEDINNNGGESYINYIDSEVMDYNGMKQNNITMESLINALYKNEERIKKIKKERYEISSLEYNNMQMYIQNNYSWNRVSHLLYDYFKYIVDKET